MKFNELGRSFFRKMVQIRRYFVTTCTIRSTRGAKLPIDATFSGRSMVEMLGVLAIIGVLSVGAIAGYSKAMMKYKLNKQAEQISFLLSSLFPYGQSLGRGEVGASVNLVPIIGKLHMVSEDMLYQNGTKIKDALGTSIEINSVKEQPANSSAFEYYAMSFIFDDSPYDFESCLNLWNIIKGFSGNIWHAGMYKIQGGEDDVSQVHGDYTCTNNRKCLRDLQVSDIYTMCKFCEQTDYCRLTINWSDNPPNW